MSMTDEKQEPSRAPATNTSDGRVTAWLIEMNRNDAPMPRYWHRQKGWVFDPHAAQWFVRREDAEADIFKRYGGCDLDGRAVEHVFGIALRPDSVAPAAPTGEIGALCERLRSQEIFMCEHGISPLAYVAADALTALAAENARLREALTQITDTRAFGDPAEAANVFQDIARAALAAPAGEKKNPGVSDAGEVRGSKIRSAAQNATSVAEMDALVPLARDAPKLLACRLMFAIHYLSAANKSAIKMKEAWLPIETWEGIYEVSNFGRVASCDRVVSVVRYDGVCYSFKLRRRVLRPSAAANGYLIVSFTTAGRRQYRYVHELVATHFISKRPNGLEVCHLNGVRSDCRMSNLRWGSRSSNALDRHLHGTMNQAHGEAHSNAKLTEADVRWIRANSDRLSYREMGRRLGVCHSTVALADQRKQWRRVS
jgi:hypothetical protein